MSEFIAALPMYDWPEVRAEVDAQWAALRERFLAAGIDAPARLVRRNAEMPPVPGGIRDPEGAVIAPDPATLPPDDLHLPTLWRHPRLLFAQTCWGPMETTGLAGHVDVVGQPDYSDVEGGAGELYSSAVVMRTLPPPLTPPHKGEGVASASESPSPLRGGVRDGGAPAETVVNLGGMSGRTEGGNAGRQPSSHPASSATLPLDLLRNARLAFNEPQSMSGLLALTRDLEAMGKGLSIFPKCVETGGHRLSIRAVAEGRADVATVDCRSWHLARLHEPAAASLRVVGWTARRKGLPCIRSARLPAEILRYYPKLM